MVNGNKWFFLMGGLVRWSKIEDGKWVFREV